MSADPEHTDLAGPAPVPGAELMLRRQRIVQVLLTVAVVLGAVALVPSIALCLRTRTWSIVYLDAFVYAGALAMWLAPPSWYRARAGAIVGICFCLGIGLTVEVGPMGAGVIWLAAVPILAAVLFGLRETLATLALVTASGAAFFVALQYGLPDWSEVAGDHLLWLATFSNTMVVAGMLSLAVATLIRGLQLSAQSAERFRAAAVQQHLQLLDANERLRTEMRERELAEAQLRQAEKLTAIGTLASGIAHDMNNLLTPILASAELLRAEEAPGSSRAVLLERTLEAARGGKDLVRRILAFSRPSGEGRTHLDAAAAFGDAARLLRATLPAGIEVRFRASEQAGCVLLTPAEAHQVVLNLGTNAHQAMPDGGTLEIEVREVPAGSVPRAHGGDAFAGDAVCLTVKDTGTGMDESTRRRAFEPFFTTRDHGSGIGLASVHGVVSSAGGFVTCESVLGRGTTMSVYLPRPAGGGPPVALAAPRVLPSGHGEHVLIVDDEPAVRVVAQRVLERGGYRVTGVADVNAALGALGEAADFQLVLTDLSMPGRDGLALAGELRDRGTALPVILMSGIADAELRARARSVGVCRLVAKPFEPHELLSAVGDTLRQAPQDTLPAGD